MHKKSKSSRAAQAAQAEILAAIQHTGNNVAEVMNSLQALGAKFGINVNFTLGYKKSGENKEIGANGRRVGHGIHAERVEDGQCQTQRKLQKKPQISKISKISSRNPEEITIPELAAMVADELGMNEDCALDALETAFELLEEYSLILDIGDIGILAGHEVSEVSEIHDDFCEAYNPCKVCENFNTCGYCSRDEDEEEDEDSYENTGDNDIDDGDDSEYDDEE